MRIKKIDKELLEMLNELKSASRIYSPSPMWQTLNRAHLNYITKYRIKQFKRSINREYFDWGISTFYYQQRPVFSELKKFNIRPVIQSKLVDNGIKYDATAPHFSVIVANWLSIRSGLFAKIKDKWHSAFNIFNGLEPLTKIIYKTYIAYLYDYVSRIDHLGLLKKLSEPTIGSPILVDYRGKLISQDLCNSVHEFYSITGGIKINDNLEIGELGAGYGRLAYVFLKALPKVNYCIIDIPPALYVAQEYLRKTLPREKIFSFRTFKNFKRIEKEFQNSRIKFLMPHQLEYLPSNFFDIMINISSFQEMQRDHIKNYLQQADRLTKGFFILSNGKRQKPQIIIILRRMNIPFQEDGEKYIDILTPFNSYFLKRYIGPETVRVSYLSILF